MVGSRLSVLSGPKTRRLAVALAPGLCQVRPVSASHGHIFWRIWPVENQTNVFTLRIGRGFQYMPLPIYPTLSLLIWCGLSIISKRYVATLPFPTFRSSQRMYSIISILPPQLPKNTYANSESWATLGRPSKRRTHFRLSFWKLAPRRSLVGLPVTYAREYLTVWRFTSNESGGCSTNGGRLKGTFWHLPFS